jgi:hypothetical protein
MFVETLHATSLQNGIVSIYISICYDFDHVIRNWILFRPPPSAFFHSAFRLLNNPEGVT